MKILIVGPCRSGKTVLLHKIIQMNTQLVFDIIIDGYENFFPVGGDRNLPNAENMLITAQNVNNIPAAILHNCLILKTPEIRL